VKSINRKLHAIENCVLDVRNIDFSTTKISYESLSEPEQKVMDKAQEIARYWDRKRELTDYERLILEKAGQIMTARIGWLFRLQMSTLLCGEDNLLKFLFETRLLWFIDEMIDFIHQMKEENRIFSQKGKTWKQKEKEAKETIYKKWKKPFTPESYTEFIKPVFKRMHEDLGKKR